MHSFSEVLVSWRSWWRTSVIGTVDQLAVIETRREDSALSSRYLFMLAMSAAIAVLGLLLSSPAVVIGAMLLSPLMGPIIGLGFALATGDYVWMRMAAKSLAIGTAMAILMTALIVFMSPLQTITSEIAARTKPNLFDLGIAFFSALAGAYAMIRGREGTVVGVAIATALMPPLAVVGFGLATWNGTVFWGALFLFITNLLTIALTAWVMARLYGFRTRLSEKQTMLQSVAIVVVFVALAIPLGVSLINIANETRAQRDIRSAVLTGFGNNARLSDLQISWESEPVQINATVLTPDIKPDAEAIATRAIERSLDEPFQVVITQYEVGTGEDAAERAQLAAAQAQEEANLRRAEELALKLALVAGVEDKDVLVDRQRRQAVVTAKPLDGAALSAYRELEKRIAATEPEWQVRIRPPARPLPNVEFDDGELTEAGMADAELIAWAANRVGAPIVLVGGEAETAKLAEIIEQAGGTVSLETRSGNSSLVLTRWGAPGE
jgi:uncharacterized hydrophobic protein (TIGR00271 family)